jgi:hypothetical protein
MRPRRSRALPLQLICGLPHRFPRLTKLSLHPYTLTCAVNRRVKRRKVNKRSVTGWAT